MLGICMPCNPISSLACVLLLGLSHAHAAEAVPLLETYDLRGFDDLSEPRQKLIQAAFEAGKEVAGMPYKYGGNSPEDGGFDCSGAVHYVLHKAGLNPPRTSANQFLWVRENSKLHPVPAAAVDAQDKCFSKLKPGDLVFWSGTYEPKDGRLVKITHVAIFLGYEKKDGRAVMINATDGRSYRGKKGNGFGVYDFRVPRKGGKSRMVGYGTPPGLGKGEGG
jgi:cell wall-associated NlpC family hydrolase